MARKTAYRRYYRRYRRRYRISANYFKVKAEASGVISYPTNIDGQPILLLNQAVQGNRLTFKELLENSTYQASFVNIFSFWRMTGMAIEVIPSASNSGGNKIIENESPVYIAPRAGAIEAMSYAEAKAINSAIMLNPLQAQRKYTKFYGFYGDWISTSSFPTGAVSVASLLDGQRPTKPEWTFKVTMYLLYKKSRV